MKMPGHIVCALAIGTLGGSASACAEATPQGKTHRSTTLVDYMRSGGVAGRKDRLVVRHSGRTVLTTRLEKRQAFALRRNALRRLRSALKRAAFSKLDAVYETARPVPDDFEIRITYGRRTVRADGAALPPELDRVVAILNSIVAER